MYMTHKDAYQKEQREKGREREREIVTSLEIRPHNSSFIDSHMHLDREKERERETNVDVAHLDSR